MITAILRLVARNHILKSLPIFGLFFFSHYSFGQLTHVQAEISIDSSSVSLNDSTEISVKTLITTITPDDMNDFGAISVVVYDTLNLETPLLEIVKTKVELVAEGAIYSDTIRLQLVNLSDDHLYKIYYYPQTLTGAYGNELILNYPN